jgi:hypothetical protein
MPQSNVVPLNPAVTPFATWPDTNDGSDLLAIVQAQTETIADQAVLIDRYQAILNTAQVSPPAVSVATGTGTATGTSLAVTAVNGTIAIGAVVSGAGVPPGTTIMSQASGTTGGNGSYVTNQATTASAAALAFSAPPNVSVATATGTGTGTSLAVTAVNGTIVLNANVSGAGVPSPTVIIAQISGTAGGAGTYTTSQPTTAAAAPLAFTPPPVEETSPWPVPRDPPTLMTISQNQTALIRTQNALIQHYQETLNSSQTPIS